MLAETIVEGLNPEQRLAVETTEGPLLVLAGAGSGKTRVLTCRIAHLIGVCGIPSESILAVTFTNKAAGEMKERVEKMLGPDVGSPWISTFHSMCVRILRRDIGALGRSRGFVIYDDADSLGVAKEVLKRHGIDARAYEPKRLRWRLDQWKNQGLLPATAAEEARDIDDELTAELYATYQRLLLDANALDFGDLLLQTRELFRRAPEVLAHYQRRWQYVLVDEYQDTNRVQYDLVRLLAEGHRNLCVVGDPDQSIYAWRGADIRNILDFERDYPNARTIALERNYRSTQPILSGATAVVENNASRKKKEMFTEREGGELIQFHAAEDDRTEASWVVGHILHGTRNEHRKLGDYAILYRTNAQSRAFEEELLKYDLSYAVVGGVRFYERAEIKDVLCYLRLLVNPDDAQALLRVVNKPARGIGKTTVERAGELAASRNVPLRQGLALFGREAAPKRTAARIAEFLELLDELRARFAARPVDEILAEVIERSGYMRALALEDSPEAEARIENLRELVASAEDFHAVNAGATDEDRTELELYLDQVALISDVDGYDHRADSVSLMTTHSAKGLEYPVVFLVGLEEGVFPHATTMRDDGGLEEERRLCYVGMTRAMEKLYMTCASERRRFGQRSYQSPSRFLSEVPEALMEIHAARPHMRRARPQRPAPETRGRLDRSYSQEAFRDDDTLQGMRVRHSVFGAGTVVAVIGAGLDQKLKIKFDRAGIKTIMVRYANLEPL